MRVIDAFAGIGGFSLAADALGWETVAFVERDPDCQFWLGQHWPGVPIYGDICAVRWEDAPPCDVFTAGFPCQPASVAGKRAGQADERWLWDEVYRGVRDLRPRYLVAENVPGLATLDDESEQPNDRCVCGWPRRWRRVLLNHVKEGSESLRRPLRYGDDGEGAAAPEPDDERVRRIIGELSASDGEMGSGLALVDVGTAVADRPDSLASPSAPETPSGDSGPTLLCACGRAAENGEDGPSCCLECGGEAGGCEYPGGDDGAEPEGAAAGDWRPVAGDCEACGRRLGDEPTRLVRGGLFQVLRTLAEIGYDARWDHLSAAECGAPHKRERVWIVAHPDWRRCEQRHTSQRQYRESDSRYAAMGDTDGERGEERDIARIATGSDIARCGCAGMEFSPHIRQQHGEPIASVGQDTTSGGSGAVGNSELPTRPRHGQLGWNRPTEAGGRSEAGVCVGRGYTIRSPWADAIPYRGADGTVRLIPAGAVADLSGSGRAAGHAEQARRDESDGAELGQQLHGRHEEVAGAEPALRLVVARLSHNLAGRHAAEEAKPSLWPVTDSEPGRVARLRAVGNAVVPAWVLAGPFRYILDREAAR